MIDRQQRLGLLGDLRRELGVDLLWFERLSFPGYRDDVTVHGFFSPPDKPVTDESKLRVRRWVESRGWQFSRQLVRAFHDDADRVEHIYLAPEARVTLSVGYHATRRASLLSILERGLIPGEPDRRTTEREDCDGNVYVCEALGTPADAGVRGAKTAHWWRDHLTEKNRFGDPDWVILRVEVAGVPGIRACRDLWSESGIVLDGVEVIPPEVIRLEYGGS